MKTDDIDISSYKYGIKFLIENDFIASNVTEIYEYVNNRKFDDVNKMTENIKELSTCLVNLGKLSKQQDKLYSYKQSLIQRKQEILDDQSYINKDFSIMKKERMVEYKIGNNSDGFRPSNDTERKLFIDSKMSGMQLCIDTLDNHINFMIDSIKTMTEMIYGVQYALELENFRKLY